MDGVCHRPRITNAKYIQADIAGLGFSPWTRDNSLRPIDLQPANIMFPVVGTSSSDDFLQPPEFSPVTWLGGVEKDDSAPRYLMASQRIRGTLDNADLSTLLVKIGDVGGATLGQQHDELLPVTPNSFTCT
ncbi:hypothetical protein UA08_09090 [Talaromyces atroroseus]|uniref:Uncharacterized protein n=1 Tax=Talaromyces atroroseus TaxID=1441469 RepID=A0A1Q5Q7A2_TALAT|nr:hypothetical protein UA08_09090 [Talaromyces atroroseus]OKL55726.1 hypothetical protein UA08_09090 [Talaromyces atroroseus]